ncbi:MAG: TauD/TfdA dioxygenase family protein [bacterium]
MASKVKFVPIAGARLGARVENFDFTNALTNEEHEMFEDAFERYGVLVVDGQSPSPENHIDFSSRFGYLETASVDEGGHQDHPELMVVGNQPGRLISFSPTDPEGDLEWHADNMHLAQTAKVSILHAIEVPEEGGDTLFACMYAAYEDLSESEQQTYERLKMRHSIAGLETYLEKTVGEATKDAIGPTHSIESVVWPLVRRHRRSGRRSLYFGSHVTIGVEGWSEDEGRSFIQDLTKRATRSEMRYRHKWTKGDVVMWDNRRVVHAGTYYDVNRSHRLMFRTTVRDA